MLKTYAFVTWPLFQGQSMLKMPRILFLDISIHVWLCMYILKKHRCDHAAYTVFIFLNIAVSASFHISV